MATNTRFSTMTFENLPSLTIEQLCNANFSSLKAIITSAPSPIRESHQPLPRAVYKLLAIVLSLREDLLQQHPGDQEQGNVQSDKALLERMLTLSDDELNDKAENSLGELVSMINASLRLDPSLQPRVFDETDKAAIIGLVLRWQLQATRAALDRRETQAVLADASEPKRLHEESPPSAEKRNPLSDVDTSVIPRKRQKVLRVAGVPTGENLEDMQDFWSGAGGSTPIRPSQLREYPGRTAVLLNVQELMGPSILHSFCQEGINVELVVRNMRWPRQADGRPYRSEVEALTLARCLHFHLCRFETMEQAIVTAPWTEIAFRRLWALLEVQTLTSGPSPLSRGEAWQQVLPSLEVYPDIGLRVPAMRSIVNRQVSAASRARNAVRSLSRRPMTQGARSLQKKKPDATGEKSGIQQKP